MQTNIYRCTKACDDCPFIAPEKLHISPETVSDIKEDLDKGGNFICHKTAYPDIFDQPKETKPLMCWGAWKYLTDTNNPNQIMQIAERLEKAKL